MLLWDLLATNHKKDAVLLVLLILVGTTLEVAGLGLIIPLANVLTSPDTFLDIVPFAFLRNIFSSFQADQILYVLLSLFVGINLTKALFMVAVGWIQAGFTLNVQSDLARRLLKLYLTKQQLEFQSQHTATYIQNINHEIRLLTRNGVSAAMDVVTSTSLLLFAVSLLLAIDPIPTLFVSMALTIGIPTFQAASKKRVRRWGIIRQHQEKDRLKVLQQALFSFKELKIKKKQEYFIRSFHNHSVRLIHTGRWQATVRKIPKNTFEFSAVLGLALLIIFMIEIGRDPSTIASTVAVFAAVFIRLIPSVNTLVTSLHAMRYIGPLIEQMHNDLFNVLTTKIISGEKREVDFTHLSLQKVNF